MEEALRNSPQDVDKAGGHGLCHDPKIMLDMKIPLEPNLFWKSWAQPEQQRGAAERKSHWESGAVLEAPLENVCGWWGLACDTSQPGLRSLPGTPGSRG